MEISIVEFTDQLDLIMPEIVRGFVRQAACSLHKSEITFPQVMVMEFLLKNGSIRMTDIAKLMAVTTAAATGIAERMVRKGYLRRDFDASDRRIVKIELTDRGRVLIKDISVQRRKAVIKVFGRLPAVDRENYLRILQKVKDVLSLEKGKLK